MIFMNYYRRAMKRVLFAAMILIIMPLTRIMAQDQDNLEKLTAYKIAFFTQKLNLTPAEAERFWPLYNDFSARRSKLQLDRGSLIRYASQNEANMPDKELTETANKLAQTFVDEANLVVTFNNEIQKILPPGKVIRLYQAEGQYKQQLLKELNERRQGQQGPGQNQGQRQNPPRRNF